MAQAVDAFVHPKWRERGIFVGLGRILLEDLGSKGIHLTYGIPNKAAMPGHRRLSWSIVARVSKYVRIIDMERAIQAYGGRGARRMAFRVAAALKSRSDTCLVPRGVSLIDTPMAWSKVNEVWRKSAGDYDFALDRNSAYLAWRYSTESGQKYVVMLRERETMPVAVSMLRIGQDGFGQIAELFSAAGHENDARILLQGVVAYLAKNGCHTIEALASTKELRRLMRAKGFFRASTALLIAHANDVSGNGQLSTLMNARRIMLSFGDSDLV